jgi:two-component system nitrogen regulation sensor histidine kinase NtrY
VPSEPSGEPVDPVEPVKPADPPPVRALPFRDNPRLLILAVIGLLALLGASFFAATRTDQVRDAFVSDVVLYALSAVDLAMLAGLLFILVRNIVKLVVERRRGLPFAHFRSKLVAALLAMTIVPAVLVLIIGGEIINRSAQRWFSIPATELVEAAKDMAQTVYAERVSIASARADRLAQRLPPDVIAAGDAAGLQPHLAADVALTSSGLIEVYRVATAAGTVAEAIFVTSVGESTMPRNHAVASADRLAARVAASGRAEQTEDQIAAQSSDEAGTGRLIRAAAPIRNSAGAVVGVVVASEALSGKLNTYALRMTTAFSQYEQSKVLKGPLQGFYLMFFLMVTLLILVSATWLGLYVAKRITRPVQMLAEGARALGAGQLDLRIEPDSTDELGSLVESFNTMASDLRSSHERLDARRRYIETILERVATGVISLTSDGRISTVNGAAARLLGLDAAIVGQSAIEVFSRADLAPLQPIIASTVASAVPTTGAPAAASAVEEITIARDDREIHLAVAATVLIGDAGQGEGAVVVLDDVTPLIRAQRVAAWRDVARRLAHEIKNPLTPIQLSAERLQRNFATAPPNARALVEECTSAIITEVEALKGLVDEFAQFARMRGPKLVSADLNLLAADTLRLYRGVLQQGAVELTIDVTAGLPRVRMDAEQMRQVIINLVDNAIDALGGASAARQPDGAAPRIVVATSHDQTTGLVRLTVSDNGPGIPAADRDKLFLPYYSTKGRGSGLGLAIVRRIITEHGGGIEVADVAPHGTTFTVDLPAA